MKRNRNIILLLLLACAQMIMAQHVLTGTVMDKVFNEPLVGANVYVANASNRSLGGSIADVMVITVCRYLIKKICLLYSLLLVIKHKP